jgi:hypothetical protein
MSSSIPSQVLRSTIKFGDARAEHIQRHLQEDTLPSALRQIEEQEGDSWSNEAIKDATKAGKVKLLGEFRKPDANKISPEVVATLREANDKANEAAVKIDPKYAEHMDLLHKAMTYSEEGTPFLLRDNGISSSKEVEHLIAIDEKQPRYNRFTIRAAKFQEDAHHLAKNFLQKIYDAVIEPFRAFFQKLKNLFGESEASRHEEAQLRDESGQHKMSTHHKAPTVEEVTDESFFKPAPETTEHAQNAKHHAKATVDDLKQAASAEKEKVSKEMEEVKKSA